MLHAPLNSTFNLACAKLLQMIRRISHFQPDMPGNENYLDYAHGLSCSRVTAELLDALKYQRLNGIAAASIVLRAELPASSPGRMNLHGTRTINYFESEYSL